MTKLKKAVQYLLMLTCICGVFSCSDDENTTTPSKNDITGTYTGYHVMASAYFSGMYGINDTVSVTVNNDGTATVVFNNDSWETTLTNVIVTAEENGYKLSGSGKMSMAGMSGQKADYDCTLEGTISKDKSSCNLVFTLPSVMKGTTITFTNGEVPAASYIADSYTGYHEMSSQYFSGMYGINDTINITANDDGTATVVFNNDSWETTLTNVTVALESDEYKLSGSGKMSMAGMSGKIADYDCTFEGTISKDKSSCNLVFTLPSVMGGTTIAFTNGELPAAKYIAGSYDGWVKMVMAYAPDGINYDGQSITITANEDGTVNVVYSSTDLGDATISNVAVTKDGDSYKLEGEGTMLMGMSEKKSEYACQLSGTISADKETYSIVLTLPSVMQGTTITFTNGDIPVAQNIAGSYDGWVKMVMAYAPDGINYDGQSITITANEDGTVNVVYSSTDLGEATISNVAVTKDGDSYKLAGEGTMLMGMSEKKSDYACQLSGTISADKETYSIVLTLPSVMGGTTITFANGSAPAAE